MQISIELDLPSIISQAVSAERIQPIVDKAINDALKSAITDATGYRSPFREALETQLKDAMPHGLALDDVAKFQHILNGTMNKLAQECNHGTINSALEKAVKDVMPDVPQVIKMSELIEDARAGFHKESHEAFYAYFEPSEHGGGGHLYLDHDENPGSKGYGSSHRSREDQKYSATCQLAFTKDGDVYALRLDGKQITPSSRPDIAGRFDSILMAMYVGRTKIEVDIDADDVESASQEQYD